MRLTNVEFMLLQIIWEQREVLANEIAHISTPMQEEGPVPGNLAITNESF